MKSIISKYRLKSCVSVLLVAMFTAGLSVSNGMNNANAESVERFATCADNSDCATGLTCQREVCVQATLGDFIGDFVCNVFKLVTGKAGRTLIAIVLIGAGSTFLLGRMQLGSLLAIGAGAGFIFGVPAVAKVLIGRGFDC